MMATTEELEREVAGKIWATLISPRPLALVVTISSDGTPNIAPFNSVAGVSNYPPMLTFSVGKRTGRDKFTLENLRTNPLFTVNVVSEGMSSVMSHAAEGMDRQDDFHRLDLVQGTFTTSRVPFIAESPASMACEMVELMPLSGSASTLVIARITELRIDDRFVENGLLDPVAAKLMASIGVEDYMSLSGVRFRIPRTWE